MKQTRQNTSSYGIQFIHEPVREFFSANDYRIPRQLHGRVVSNFEVSSHNLLMLSCLRYIAVKDLRRDTKPTIETLINPLHLSDSHDEVLAHSPASSFIGKAFEIEFPLDFEIRYPFFKYAISNFPNHAKFRDCDSEEVRGFDLIDHLIGDNGSLLNFIASSQSRFDNSSSIKDEDGLFCNGLLQFFARRGSHTCVSKLLDLRWNPNMRRKASDHDRSPL
jgi:hypothetical protein